MSKNKKVDKVLSEQLLRASTKKQMANLFKEINKSGGDIGMQVRKGEKTKEDKMPNSIYMDNPFGSSRKIETYEDFSTQQRKTYESNITTFEKFDTDEVEQIDESTDQPIKIELKNVRYHQGHDGDGLNADLFINGIKCLHIYDDARGGEFQYTPYTHNAKDPEKIKTLINLFDEYVESLPEETITDFGDKPFQLKPDRDTVIGKLEEEWAKAKNERKFNKQMETRILFGIPGEDSYRYFDIKRPLKSIPKETLQKFIIDKVKPKLVNGIEILNTNLEELGISLTESIDTGINERIATKLEDFYMWKDRKIIDLNDDSWVKGTKEDFLRPMFKNLPDHKDRFPYDILRSGKFLETKDGKIVGQIDTLKGKVIVLDIINDENKHEYKEFNLVKLVDKIKDKELKVTSNTKSKKVKIDTPWGTKFDIKENE